MISNTLNLDGLTLVQKFEVSLQVASRTWFNNIQARFDFEFEYNSNQLHTVDSL
jgi:hypothetical protein